MLSLSLCFISLFFFILVSPVAKPIISSKTAVAEPKTAKPATVKVQNLTHEQEYQDLELSSMRRTIAKRLTASKVRIFQQLQAQFGHFKLTF